jgi:wyosine [tRNA(Phe)-imidazoG37] synthetase (radical SAM superfamily)
MTSERPATAYLAEVTRPPAEAWVRSPDERKLARAWHTLADRVGRVEYLSGDEGNRFVSTGVVERDLLAITAVHPMRQKAVESLLGRAGEPWSLVEGLLDEGTLVRMSFGGHAFFVRRRS